MFVFQGRKLKSLIEYYTMLHDLLAILVAKVCTDSSISLSFSK